MTKLSVFSAFVIALASSQSFALVRVVAECQTPDGYQIAVLDNQGIGPVRSSHFSASVRDAGGETLANYDLTEEFVGTNLSYIAPDFNLTFRNVLGRKSTELSAKLPNGQVLESDDVKCTTQP